MLRHIVADNVRQAYSDGVSLVLREGELEESRNGPVRVLDGPLVTTYQSPCERVLLDPQRDANPFFHLMEAFWMLAGRRDVASLMRYNSGMLKYSDDGVNFHGAYGYRWRHHFGSSGSGRNQIDGTDQLATIIQLLRDNPADRRIVLQMWDPTTDLGAEGVDFPCNNLCYFRIVGGRLDMNLTCRSNDMIWGGYGANAVHFSVLQEFVAAMVGVGVGEMHQISNNAHVYVERTPTEILPHVGYPEQTMPLFGNLRDSPIASVLQEIEALWDDDVSFHRYLPISTHQLVNSMRLAWDGWKTRHWAMAIAGARAIPHEDWRVACEEWLARREEKFS